MVRSSHAHGIIKGIGTAAAKAMPGVLGGLDRQGSRSRRLQPLHLRPALEEPGRLAAVADQPSGAGDDKVRFVGDPIAFVVAETLAQAPRCGGGDRTRHRVAAGRDRCRRGHKTRRSAALRSHPEQCGARLSYGDTAKIDAAFASAAHVTKLDIVNTRVAVVSMEPRVALAAFDKAAEHFTLQVPTQGVSGNKVTLAKNPQRAE